MANHTFLRYLPARLKPLSSPAVWAPLTVFALASIFMWEYHQNPEWFDRPQADTISPASGLTPEEQARLSEVDTIDVLLGSLKDSSSSSTGTVGLVNKSTSEGKDATSSRELADRENPFADYEKQYKFPGSGGGTSAAAPSQPSAFPAVRSTDGAAPSGKFDFGSGAALPNGGALSEALGRQQAGRAAAEQARENVTEDNASQSASQSASQNASRSTRAATTSSGSAFRPSAQPSNSTSNSSISAPFIRTTPDMSPPVGTTGYQAPASSSLPVFNRAPQQPSQNPYSTGSGFSNFSQPAARPATPATSSSSAGAASEGRLYTAPSFTQPAQNR